MYLFVESSHLLAVQPVCFAHDRYVNHLAVTKPQDKTKTIISGPHPCQTVSKLTNNTSVTVAAAAEWGYSCSSQGNVSAYANITYTAETSSDASIQQKIPQISCIMQLLNTTVVYVWEYTATKPFIGS